eukprot:CAMPEP_0170546870 /NCGR_PEP_ID=MMETSP0211-20121228/5225_1 /TAXON_ID=311385 /ORGANISM="Pseudokeronopsis sp., Strain OXSARD2" /LENGTH=62 /DNA_ID=CAMNT_0010851559 /DNA_START=1 /DNA_END=189 /DNA_ORIENTATION=+
MKNMGQMEKEFKDFQESVIIFQYDCEKKKSKKFLISQEITKYTQFYIQTDTDIECEYVTSMR